MLIWNKVVLEDITSNALQKLVYISRYSTNRQDKEITQESAEEFIRKNVIKRKHYSIGRHVIVRFSIECSRCCQNQLVRSAHLSYMVESQRYVEFDNVFITPESILNNPDAKIVYDIVMNKALQGYNALLKEHSISKEDARYLLPNACITRMAITGNLQAWRDFVNLRTSKGAQNEIKLIAKEILRQLLASEVGVFFEDLKGKEQ